MLPPGAPLTAPSKSNKWYSFLAKTKLEFRFRKAKHFSVKSGRYATASLDSKDPTPCT